MTTATEARTHHQANRSADAMARRTGETCFVIDAGDDDPYRGIQIVTETDLDTYYAGIREERILYVTS